jgi:hypothetical protein
MGALSLAHLGTERISNRALNNKPALAEPETSI